jgi:hypothetical protein
MIRIDDNTVFNPENGEFGYLPDIIQFEIDRELLTDSNPAIVTWTISNASKVFLNDEIVEPTGSKEFYTLDLMEIILVAENELGQTSPRKLIIDIDRTPPIIHSFKIKEIFAIKGHPITLTWNVEGYHSLTIDNGIGAVTGLSEKMATLGNHGVFKLIAKNYFGIESFSEASVTIFPTPLIENIFIQKPLINFQAVASNQPSFNIGFEFNSTEITPNVNFINLSNTGLKLTFADVKISSEETNLDCFDYLTRKQKEIVYIVKSVWTREGKQILKRILRQN